MRRQRSSRNGQQLQRLELGGTRRGLRPKLGAPAASDFVPLPDAGAVQVASGAAACER
jgi:hypothetical protein